MEVKKVKGQFNEYDLKGLTEGKILAIKRALEFTDEMNELGPVGFDVLVALKRWEASLS